MQPVMLASPATVRRLSAVRSFSRRHRAKLGVLTGLAGGVALAAGGSRAWKYYLARRARQAAEKKAAAQAAGKERFMMFGIRRKP